MGSPAPVRCWPPIVMVRSAPSPASSLILFSTAARSGLPGTYWRTGSLAGCGTWVTASMGGPPALLPVIVDGHSMVTRGGHRSRRRGHGEHKRAVAEGGQGGSGRGGAAGVQGGKQRDAERPGQPFCNVEKRIRVGHPAFADTGEEGHDQRLDGEPQNHSAPAQQAGGHPERGRGGKQ